MFWVQACAQTRHLLIKVERFDWICMSALICLACTCNSEWKQGTGIWDNNTYWQCQKLCISTFAIRNWRNIGGTHRTLFWWPFLVPVSCLLGCALKPVSSLFSLPAFMIARAANRCRMFHFYSLLLALPTTYFTFLIPSCYITNAQLQWGYLSYSCCCSVLYITCQLAYDTS